MDRSHRIILFAHPRSGSTSLYQILQLHPALNILVEPFNENFTSWYPERENYLERIHDIPSLDAVLADIYAGYNGIKVLNYQLPDELGVHLLQRPDSMVVFLRRRNLLQAVVSVLIAHQTDAWSKWEMKKPVEEYYRDLQPFDIAEIQQRIAILKEHMDYFESVVDALPAHRTVKFTYEDLYFAPAHERDAQMAAMWHKLGLAPLESEQIQYYLQPESVKMNPATAYGLLPNAQEIHERCGNDVTGWLFE